MHMHITKDDIHEALIELVGFIELIIGLATLLFVVLFDIFSIVDKPFSVFVFVVISAAISASIGFGILNLKNWARKALVYFSGYVIFIKVMLFLGVITFSAGIITVPPTHSRNIISMLYHIALIIFFTNAEIMSRFTSAKQKK